MVKLLKHNLSFDTLDGYEVSLIDSFFDALTTPKGSVIYYPEYGTILYTLKHRGIDGDWLIDFKRCLKDACSFDKRLTYKNSNINASEAGAGVITFEVYIDFFSLSGVVNV